MNYFIYCQVVLIYYTILSENPNSKSQDNSLSLLGPVLMSLKPGCQVAESYSEMSKGLGNSLDTRRSHSRPGALQLAYIQDQLGTKDGKEDSGNTEDDRSRTPVSNGEDLALCSPPRTENEVLNDFGHSSSLCSTVCTMILFSRASV